MNPLLTATLRRHWPLLGAVAMLAVLTAAHQIWFRPTVRRYEVALERANDLGLSLDPDRTPAVLPPRLFALLADNSLPPQVAEEQGSSGTLTAKLLEDLTLRASQHGIRVVSTEPGPMNQQTDGVQVRAHLELRCTYAKFLELLQDLSKQPRLCSVDRFSLTSPGGEMALDLWVSRYVIKQGKGRG